MRRKFNVKMLNYLKKKGKKHTLKEWTRIINKKFSENFTLTETQRYFVRNKIEYKYENKNKSHKMGLNYPIGYEYRKKDGMVLVKINENTYEYKQRLIYEQFYGVKLTSDDYIIFLDQDRTNFDISNLKRVSRRESSILSNQKIFSKDPNVTKLGISVAKTIIKTKDCEALYGQNLSQMEL